MTDTIETLVYTAVSELPDGTHEDDVLDAVCGMMDWKTFQANEQEIITLIRKWG